MVVKIETPLRWEEDTRSGSVTLVAADGAVILSDHSREVMPEWLDQIVRAVNAHDPMRNAIERYLNLDSDCDYTDGFPDVCPGIEQQGGPCHWCELNAALKLAKVGAV